MKKILSIGMFIVLFNIILVIENTTALNPTIEGVPIIFINDKMFVGFSSEIGEKIKAEVERCCSIPCVDLTLVEKGEITNIANYSSSNAQDYSLIGWVFLIIVA